MTASRTILIEMVRTGLELAFEHLTNGLDDLALREIDSAREKILQLSQMKAVAVPQQPLLTLTTHDQFRPTHEPGINTEVNR